MRYLNLIYLKQAQDFLSRYGIDGILTKIPEYIQMSRKYQVWRSVNTPGPEQLAQQRELAEKMAVRPLFSILVPAYCTDPLQLRQMLSSVCAQTYGNWELCIADGSPEELSPVLQEYPDGRIRYEHIENRGIAGNTNAALAMASGDFIVLLDHDDMLSPDALYELAAALGKDASGSTDVLYSDEDMVSGDGTFFHNPNFKPGFNPDLLRSCNYITHLYAVRRTLALQAGGFSEDCDGSQDYDFVLKTAEKARTVCHIPKILYHWRVHNGSVAADSSNKTYAYDSAVRALERHYERLGISAAVSKDPQPGFYRTEYTVTGRPLISVLMRRCPASLKDELTAQVRCWSEAAAQSADASGQDGRAPEIRLEFPASLRSCRGDHILVLNEVSSLSANAIPLLLANCQRSEIGIAAPRILTEKNRVAETGLIYNAEGEILSPFAGKRPGYPGYHCYALCQYTVSLTGPHCFMTSAENLRWNWPKKSASGTETAKPDAVIRMARFCFRTIESGQKITVIPLAEAILTASASRRDHGMHYAGPAVPLPDYIKEHPADPYYTPNLSQKKPYTLDL